jgi:hypothetical protein
MENFVNKDTYITFLKSDLESMKQENIELKKRLEKYTNNIGHKKYKENNKEKIQEYQKEYQKKYYENKKKCVQN